MKVKFKKIVGSWYEPCDDDYSQEYDYEEEPKEIELTADDLVDYFFPKAKDKERELLIQSYQNLIDLDAIYEESLEEDDDFQEFMRDRYEN